MIFNNAWACSGDVKCKTGYRVILQLIVTRGNGGVPGLTYRQLIDNLTITYR